MTTESLTRSRAPFDELAADYDGSFTSTRLGGWLRSSVWEQADAIFAGADTLLDIGCGTGTDAVHFARRGHRVVATDASRDMLSVARKKAVRAGCARLIEFHCVPMHRLGTVLGRESFDGVFSNFGAINCASHLPALIADVSGLLRPDGRLLWVVMGRHAPWEWAWFLARLRWNEAFRRYGSRGASWRGIRVRYPSPRELAGALRPHFSQIRSRPLGVVLPPSYAAGWLNRRPALFTAFARAERMAAGMAWLAALADHFTIEGRARPCANA